MEERMFFSKIQQGDTASFEYQVLEDSNHSDLESVHEFVAQNFEKHKGAKWILLPYSCKM